jgi:hypothetical protein
MISCGVVVQGLIKEALGLKSTSLIQASLRYSSLLYDGSERIVAYRDAVFVVQYMMNVSSGLVWIPPPAPPYSVAVATNVFKQLLAPRQPLPGFSA